MHTLIIFAHPSKDSYTHAVLNRVIEGLSNKVGNTCEVIDLMAEGFDPRFTEDDYQVFHGQHMPSDAIVNEQKRIEKADVIVLIFPIYWWSMPAILKGWIDRVFSHGWAFIDEPGVGTQRLLTRLCGQIIAIGGSYRETYIKRGYSNAISKQMYEGIFGYCGITPIGFDLLLPMDDESIKEGLNQAYQVGERLQERVANGVSYVGKSD